MQRTGSWRWDGGKGEDYLRMKVILVVEFLPRNETTFVFSEINQKSLYQLIYPTVETAPVSRTRKERLQLTLDQG